MPTHQIETQQQLACGDTLICRKSLANSLGSSANNLIYTTTGGNSPQLAVNEVAKRIQSGDIDCSLIAGGEALDTFVKRIKLGIRH